jgi:glycosyltransferase involved in cell wall biosynthesis
MHEEYQTLSTTTPLEGTRVAVLVQNLPVPFDRRVWMESTALSRAGADVTVVCPSDAQHPAGDFTISGIRVIRYASPREANGMLGYFDEYVTSLRRMRRGLRLARQAGRFDVIHFCNPPDLLYTVAKSVGRRDKSVLIFDQHDVGPELVAAKRMRFGRFLVRVAEFFERQTYKAADHVISTNESYRDIAVRRGGFRRTDVTVVRSGPTLDWADDAPRSDWHEGRTHLLGYVGVMGRQEGIEYLLEAMEILVNDLGADVQLALVGSGPDRQRLEAITQKLGVSDHVTFHGRVSDDQLKSILLDSDVCVNPDEVNPMNNLSTMNKIVEYMALGRPIVQFDVKEGRYSAANASLYAAANDSSNFAMSIQRLLRDPELRRSMGAEGRKRFERVLCWERQADHLIGAYLQLQTKAPDRQLTPDPR